MTYLVAVRTPVGRGVTTSHAVPSRGTRKTLCGFPVDFRRRRRWWQSRSYAVVTCRTCRRAAGFTPVNIGTALQ